LTKIETRKLLAKLSTRISPLCLRIGALIFSCNKFCSLQTGIVYAHRNEDVVNTRTNEASNCAEDKTVPRHLEELQSKKNETMHTIKAKSYSLVQKKKEFSRIASFMGMNDLEFSKWLLSVSPLQRHEVLDRYRNAK
jgi:hypothetical protein